jgi:hypothetical protein
MAALVGPDQHHRRIDPNLRRRVYQRRDRLVDTALSRGGYVTAVDGSKAAILGKLSKDPGGAFKRSSAAEALGIVYLQAAELFFR